MLSTDEALEVTVPAAGVMTVAATLVVLTVGLASRVVIALVRIGLGGSGV